MEIGFSLGSNLGDRVAFLRQARARLLAVPGTTLLACAPLYETAPVGVQPEHADKWYINTIVVLETDRVVSEWLAMIGRIEAELGRVRSDDRNAPRPVDVDIIYADDQVVDRAELSLPHPRWSVRRFVVQPLADVRPDRVIPGQAISVQELLTLLPLDESVRLFELEW